MKFNTLSHLLWTSLHLVSTVYCTLHKKKAFSKVIHNIKIKQLHLKDTSDNKVAQIYIYIKKDNQKRSICHRGHSLCDIYHSAVSCDNSLAFCSHQGQVLVNTAVKLLCCHDIQLPGPFDLKN